MVRFIVNFFLLATTASVAFGQGTPSNLPSEAAPIELLRPTPEFQLLQDGAQGKTVSDATTKPAAEGTGGGGDNNGTNPADTAQTFVLRNEYIELGNGTLLNTTITRFNFPLLGGKAKLGFEVPFNYIDPRLPAIGPIGGLGDIKVGLSAPLWASENKKWVFVGGADFWMPTADNILLTSKPNTNTFTVQDIGTGKFRAAPFVAMVYSFDKTFFVAPVYQHEFSFAGDESRRSIHRGVVKLFLSKAFESGLYVLPEVQILIDYQNQNDLDVFLAPELGYSKKGTTLFIKPGFGINPGPNNRYIGVNFGFRLAF